MKKVTQSSDAVNYEPCRSKKVISWLTVTPAFLRMCVVKRFFETMDVNGTKSSLGKKMLLFMVYGFKS